MIQRWPITGVKRNKPDPRDWMLAAPAPKIALPDRAMLDWSGVPILDQGSRNACLGYSGVLLVRYLDWLHDKDPIAYSPLYYYARARQIGGTPLEDDDGAYIRDGFKALRKWGVCEELAWSDEHSTAEEPDEVADLAAEKHQSILFYSCPNLRTMRACIAHGRPFQFGFDCPNDIFSYSTQGTGEIYFPESKNFEGAHAIVAMGYDDTLRVGSDIGAFRLANSWSKTVGDHGFYTIPYRFFEEGHAYDATCLASVEL